MRVLQAVVQFSTIKPAMIMRYAHNRSPDELRRSQRGCCFQELDARTVIPGSHLEGRNFLSTMLSSWWTVSVVTLCTCRVCVLGGTFA